MKRRLKVLSAVLVVAGCVAGGASASSSPSVVTGGVSSVTQTSAVLHATVDPNGRATTYVFQWGLTTAYGATSAGRSAGSKTSPVAVKVIATKLIPGTVYHYRVVALSRSGGTVGADRSFKTAGPPPPTAATGPATQVTSSAATVTGVLNPNGATTTYEFQYGLTPAYTNQSIASTVASGSVAVPVSARLDGLQSGTVFHYRLVALHGSVASNVGLDGVFMTHPAKRPVAGVSARTRPGTDRRRPFAFTTTGRVNPRWIPSGFACNGVVTTKFLVGDHRIGIGLIPVANNCTFAGTTTFRKLPHRGRIDRRVHLRVLIHYAGNGYLAPNRGRTQLVTMG